MAQLIVAWRIARGYRFGFLKARVPTSPRCAVAQLSIDVTAHDSENARFAGHGLRSYLVKSVEHADAAGPWLPVGPGYRRAVSPAARCR